MQHIPGPTPAPNQTPSDKNVEAYDEKRRQPVQPPETAGYSSDMLQWCRRVGRSLLAANLKHRVRKGTDTANDNEHDIPRFPS